MGPCVESGLEDWRAELPALLEGQNQLSLALPAGLLRFSRAVAQKNSRSLPLGSKLRPPWELNLVSFLFRNLYFRNQEKVNYSIVRPQKTWVMHDESIKLRALLILNAA